MADEHDHSDDPHLAEAIARRDESRAQVLHSKAASAGAGNPDADGYAKMAAEAAQDAAVSAAALADIEPPKPDPEGTARQLADSEGNFAANAEVAAVGGIGIKGSNSIEGTGAPASTPEEAGRPIMEGAQKVVADQPVGEPATAEDVKPAQSKRGK